MLSLTWKLLFVFVCYLGISSACDTTVTGCYNSLAQTLGIQSDALQLYSLIFPQTDEAQVLTCRVVKNFNGFEAIKSCVATKKCSDTSMTEASLQVITWSSYVDYLQGLCKPGCENRASMNKKSERCATLFSGGGSVDAMCKEIGDMMQCYRDTIGTCEVQVSLIEGMFESTGFLDQIKPICKNVDFSFSSGESSEEENSVESVEESTVCDQTTFAKCFQPLGDQGNINDIVSMFETSLGKDEATVNAEQAQLCSIMSNVDMTSVKKCISDGGCADVDLLPPGSPMKMTLMDVADIMIGVCETGCENLGTKNRLVNECSQQAQSGQSDDMCDAPKKLFGCLRNVIGHCDVLVKFTTDTMSSVIDMLKQVCPNVNFDLHASSNKRNLFMNMGPIHKRVNLVDVATRFNILKATRAFHGS